MPLEFLKIHNGRNLKEFSLEAHPFFNIIYGSNGVGKTTILESVYLLLRSKTFRSSKYKSFINHDSNTCTIFSRFNSFLDPDSYNNFTLGIRRSKDIPQPIIHLNSKKINSLSTITNLVVLGLITPESFTLLDAGPSIRRKFIDWGVFHVEPCFLSDWRTYKKTLSIRNNILSSYSKEYKAQQSLTSSQSELLNCWSPQLVDLNNKLNCYRSNQINNISKLFDEYLACFSDQLAQDISLKYYQGWNQDLDYSDYLNLKTHDDLISGFTRYGTHRGELKITIKRNFARDILSRGQKKIVIICLMLAQFRFLNNLETNREHNILLLDDIDSELDETNLMILFKILHTFKCQIFVTTTNNSKFDFLSKEEHKLFHVKH